jgi:hypothetical protein
VTFFGFGKKVTRLSAGSDDLSFAIVQKVKILNGKGQQIHNLLPCNQKAPPIYLLKFPSPMSSSHYRNRQPDYTHLPLPLINDTDLPDLG